MWDSHMTPELFALLRQLERAGGPVKEVAVKATTLGDWRLSLPDMQWDAYADKWSVVDDAVLIQALRLNVRARNCAIDSYEYRSGAIEVTVTAYDGRRFAGNSRSVSSRSKDEVAAYVLAWLKAFA